MDETRQCYLSRNKTRVVQTMGRQDEFKKNKRYRGIVGMTRILADQRRSLNKQIQTDRHRDVSNTSNSSCSSQQKRSDRIAEEYGTRPRVIQ